MLFNLSDTVLHVPDCPLWTTKLLCWCHLRKISWLVKSKWSHWTNNSVAFICTRCKNDQWGYKQKKKKKKRLLSFISTRRSGEGGGVCRQSGNWQWLISTSDDNRACVLAFSRVCAWMQRKLFVPALTHPCAPNNTTLRVRLMSRAEINTSRSWPRVSFCFVLFFPCEGKGEARAAKTHVTPVIKQIIRIDDWQDNKNMHI